MTVWRRWCWNCRRWSATPRCASIHTTLSVVEALDECARGGRRPRSRDLAAAAARGRECLLSRRLYLSRTTGEPIDRKVSSFTYPPRWRFDALRCLYAFARADVPWDDRMSDALAQVLARRAVDGSWKATREHPGRVHVAMETPRAPGRWNTLRAAFVLDRYQRAARSAGSARHGNRIDALS
jgi:hypothetical protein